MNQIIKLHIKVSHHSPLAIESWAIIVGWDPVAC